MRRFIYFVATPKTTFPEDNRKAVGLGYAFDEGAEVSQCETYRGPDGEHGLLLVQGAGFISYDKRSQVWTKSANGKYWIGMTSAEPPTPADLARPEMIGGHAVKLADGHDWVVPLARILPSGTALPESLVMDKDGQWTTRPKARFAQICADAADIWAIAYEDSEDTISCAREVEIATRALALNYRVGAAELSMLEAYDTARIGHVLTALIDMPSIKKKLGSERLRISAGVTDTSQAMRPPAPTFTG